MKRSDFEKLSLDRQRVGFMLTTDERKQIYKELKLQEKTYVVLRQIDVIGVFND